EQRAVSGRPCRGHGFLQGRRSRRMLRRAHHRSQRCACCHRPLPRRGARGTKRAVARLRDEALRPPSMSRPVPQSYLAAHASFRSGTDNPRAFLERCLARLEEWEGRIHAFVSTNVPGAREAADRSSERWRAGRPLSVIDGMPLGIKDIMETADMPTQQGSPLFTGWRSVRDGAAVAAAREAGAVILGKTVTTEV